LGMLARQQFVWPADWKSAIQQVENVENLRYGSRAEHLASWRRKDGEMLTFENFKAMIREIMDLGYDEATAGRYAALIGCCICRDAEGMVVVRDEKGQELARLDLYPKERNLGPNRWDTLIRRIMALGYDEKTAVTYAVRIGEPPAVDADGFVLVQERNGDVIARIALPGYGRTLRGWRARPSSDKAKP